MLYQRWLVLKAGLWGAVAPDGLACSLGGRGVLPKRWSLLKEGVWGAVAPNGFATTLGGREPRGTGSPAQAVVGAQGGRAGG